MDPAPLLVKISPLMNDLSRRYCIEEWVRTTDNNKGFNPGLLCTVHGTKLAMAELERYNWLALQSDRLAFLVVSPNLFNQRLGLVPGWLHAEHSHNSDITLLYFHHVLEHCRSFFGAFRLLLQSAVTLSVISLKILPNFIVHHCPCQYQRRHPPLSRHFRDGLQEHLAHVHLTKHLIKTQHHRLRT